jgi:hypothetical protein
MSKNTDPIVIRLLSCCWPCRRRHYHVCLLIGPIIDGEPVEEYNRRVVRVPENSCCVEAGPYGAVTNAGGKVRDIESLGTIIVPTNRHLSTVEEWVEEELNGTVGGLSENVIKKVQARMKAHRLPPEGVETMELEVFRAVIVNRMEDKVFVYKNPSSLS